jgi:hypothetical protein
MWVMVMTDTSRKAFENLYPLAVFHGDVKYLITVRHGKLTDQIAQCVPSTPKRKYHHRRVRRGTDLHARLKEIANRVLATKADAIEAMTILGHTPQIPWRQVERDSRDLTTVCINCGKPAKVDVITLSIDGGAIFDPCERRQ